MTLLGGALLLALCFWFFHRSLLVRAGQQALSQQPDAIEFRRVTGDQWDDPVTAEWLAKPLREKGFVDLGVYHVLPLAGFKLGVMVNEGSRVAAFICERPRALGLSLELTVRYADGTSMMLVNRADSGVPKPPFFRVLFDESGAPSGALYQRLLAERPSAGIKEATPENVFAEYRSAWTRMMRWEKGRGLTAEEVADIGRGRPSISGPPEAKPASQDAWSPGFPGGAEEPQDAFQVEEHGTAVQMSWNWGSLKGTIALLMAAAAWFGIFHFFSGLGRPPQGAETDLISLLFMTVPKFAPCAGLAYLALANLLNRTEVRAGGGRLTVEHGPLPWGGSRDLQTRDIARLYSERYVSRNRGGGGRVYHRVRLVRKDGAELDLVSGLPTADRADLIVRQVMARLGA